MDVKQQQDKDKGLLDAGLNEAPEKVILGRITGVYGVKGWLKVFSHTDPMEAIVDYNPWYIRAVSRNPALENQAGWTRVKLKAGKRHAKTVVVKLEDCNDREQAMFYVGNEIAIELQQLEKLKGNNEFYWRDLIGLSVINQQGIALGLVKSLMETGANDVLVVSSETDDRERLIPWTIDIAIITVDIEQSVITVDWDADF